MQYQSQAYVYLAQDDCWHCCPPQEQQPIGTDSSCYGLESTSALCCEPVCLLGFAKVACTPCSTAMSKTSAQSAQLIAPGNAQKTRILYQLACSGQTVFAGAMAREYAHGTATLTNPNKLLSGSAPACAACRSALSSTRRALLVVCASALYNQSSATDIQSILCY